MYMSLGIDVPHMTLYKVCVQLLILIFVQHIQCINLLLRLALNTNQSINQSTYRSKQEIRVRIFRFLLYGNYFD